MQYLLFAAGIDLDRKMSKAEKNQVEQRAEEIRDTYAAKLDEVTSKPMHELTLEEFEWLVTRFIIPASESEQSRRRRGQANAFVGDLQHDTLQCVQRQAERKGRVSFWPKMKNIYRMAHRRIVREKLDWSA